MPLIVDSNVILDLITRDARWYAWSSDMLLRYGDSDALCINPIIFAEVSRSFAYIEELEEALPSSIFRREALPYEAAFLASKCFLNYRNRGGAKTSTLPDFFIGAHAAIEGWALITRDARRYATYFPSLTLISP